MRAGEPILARQGPDGVWRARPAGTIVSAPSRVSLVEAVRRELGRDDVVLQLFPKLVGVAEAAELLGWDKRRVITYVDRGSFPEPLESLAMGRVWVMDDVLAFRRAFRERQRRRSARSPAGKPN